MIDTATSAVELLRRRRIEALARRAGAHQGEARRLLADKQQLLETCRRDAAPAAPAAAALPSALAGLLAHIAGHGSAPTELNELKELKAVHEHRSTWSRLGIDLRMHQALAQVPGNAGPLNTQRLLLQALTLMQEASPQYLQSFLSQAETLLWLEAASPARVPPRKEPARGRRPAGRRP